MTLFEEYFTRVLQEDMTTATGGAWGDGSSIGQPTPFSSDFYAPGDARNVFGAGAIKPEKKPRRKKKGKKGKRGKRKKKMGEGPIMQRRYMTNGGL